MKAKISITVPVLNGVDTIERFVNSLLAQEYQNYELKIYDGGSTDGTQEWLVRNKIPFSFEPTNPIDRINRGIREMNGDIWTYPGCDDEYLPGAFNDVIDILDTSKAEWCYAPTPIGKDGWIMGNDMVTFEDMKSGMKTPWPSCFFTRKAVEMIGFFSKEYEWAADYEFAIRAFSLGLIPKRVGRTTIIYHITGHNRGMSRESAETAERIKLKYK